MIVRLVLVGAAWIFSGCAHRATAPENVVLHQQQLQKIHSWQITGKLGIRTANDSGSANLNWVQSANNFHINLVGPLGQKRLLVTGEPGKVTLEEAGQPSLVAKSAEALIHQAAGWTLPVTQLAYWIRGVPAPKQKIIFLHQNDSGLITEMAQGGWKISYSGYRDHWMNGTNLPLPEKITATYQDVRLILAIRTWQLGAPQ